MARINVEMLEKLYAHCSQPQEKLLHEKFDFCYFNKGERNAENCGTVGCLFGEVPAICPDVTFSPFKGANSFYYKGELSHPSHIAKFIFGIVNAEYCHLFAPECQDPVSFGGTVLGADAAKPEVLANLRIFIDKAKAGEIVDTDDLPF